MQLLQRDFMNVCLAHRMHQNHIDAVTGTLFVVQHGGIYLLNRIRQLCRQLVCLTNFCDLLGIIRLSQLGSELGSLHHADGNGLTVCQFGKMSDFFRAVTDGVTKVQNHAQTGVMLVLLDNIALDAHAFVDNMLHIALKVRLSNHVQNVRIGNAAIFNHFRHTIVEDAFRQGSENVGVDDDQLRLIKRADQIFALRQIDAGFSADRRIHLCKQRSRNLAHMNAAQIGCCGKAGDIADHTAAQCDDQIRTGQFRFAQIRIDTCDGI